MILTVKEQQVLNDKIKMLCEEEPSIKWVSQDECMKYKNTEYESLLIGFGKGEYTQHLKDSNVYNDVELTQYYKKQILYFMTVFRNGNSIVINTYKTHNPQENGLNLCTKVERIEV